MDYSIDPEASAGERIADMQLDDGTRIEASKNYKVTAWATVSPGEPVRDLVAGYLRRSDTARFTRLKTHILKNVAGNPCIG